MTTTLSLKEVCLALADLMTRAALRDDVGYGELDMMNWGDLFANDQLARDCWLELRQWITDSDIRQTDKEYEMRRRDFLMRRADELRQIK